MNTPLSKKSSVDEILERFDDDVERFSNLDTGQSATIDAPLSMDLVTSAAISSAPSKICRVLDIGCGAGNNSLKLRQSAGYDIDFCLLDISQPMLVRAKSRLDEVNNGSVEIIQADLRDAKLKRESFDVVLAAAVLHHLREDDDWQAAFTKLYSVLKPGGSIWITDLVSHESEQVHEMMWARYGQYLCSLDGPNYRDKVFAYIDKEDSPRSVTFQLELLRSVGFRIVELLHKNSCFAAYGAIK